MKEVDWKGVWIGVLLCALLIAMVACSETKQAVPTISSVPIMTNVLLLINITSPHPSEVICYSDRPEVESLRFNFTWIEDLDIQTTSYGKGQLLYDVKYPELRGYQITDWPEFNYIKNYTLSNYLFEIRCHSDIIPYEKIQADIWDEGYHESKHIFLPQLSMVCFYEQLTPNASDTNNWKCQYGLNGDVQYEYMMDIAFNLKNMIFEEATR